MENKNKQIREELLEIMDGLTDQQLNEHPEDGGWSISQIVEHLHLMERIITKGIADELANPVSKQAKPKPIEYTVNRSTKVEAPKFVVPSEDFLTKNELIKKLAQSRATFLQVVEGVGEDRLAKKSLPHPLFGILSLSQWIPFLGLHEKRHIAQIEELKAKF